MSFAPIPVKNARVIVPFVSDENYACANWKINFIQNFSKKI